MFVGLDMMGKYEQLSTLNIQKVSLFMHAVIYVC